MYLCAENIQVFPVETFLVACLNMFFHMNKTEYCPATSKREYLSPGNKYNPRYRVFKDSSRVFRLLGCHNK